eukprot:Ihof_evm1s701 gene=Ihof_evmTU1s701
MERRFPTGFTASSTGVPTHTTTNKFSPHTSTPPSHGATIPRQPPHLMPSTPMNLSYAHHPATPYLPYAHPYRPPFMYQPHGPYVRPHIGDNRNLGMGGSSLGGPMGLHSVDGSMVNNGSIKPMTSDAIRPSSTLSNNSKANNIAQWLTQNFEISDGMSLPRQTVYEQYEEFCRQTDQDPINAASFGKLIRAIFPSLKTRRLGTRGNSKYHYYGIRIKPNSSLPQYNPPPGTASRSIPPAHLVQGGAMLSMLLAGHGGVKLETNTMGHLTLGDTGGSDPLGYPMGIVQHNPAMKVGPGAVVSSTQTSPDNPKILATTSLPLSLFEPDPSLLSPQISLETAKTFLLMYYTHLQRLLNTASKLAFDEIEELLLHFWQGVPKRLIHALSCPHMIDIVRRCDIAVSETLLMNLIPDVLSPVSDQPMKSIRLFAKQLEGWLMSALDGLGVVGLVAAKCEVYRDFSHALRRHTSLSHLSQAARRVLANPLHVQQMREDWCRVDHQGVKTLIVAFCKCRERIFIQWQQQFDHLLVEDTSLEKWTSWLGHTVDRLLGDPQEPTYAARSRKLLLDWSFICSLFIRDLTLRSSQSFGSFHLMRLLMDEYVSYLIERRLSLPRAGPPYPNPVHTLTDSNSQVDVSMYLTREEEGSGSTPEFRNSLKENGGRGIQRTGEATTTSDTAPITNKE